MGIVAFDGKLGILRCNPTWAEFIERYTPSQASGLVHHGGFGTTAAGFKAGIPMLVIPHIIDQFIWGNKVAQLGVGPKPIARPKLTIENMTEALLQMSSPEIQDKACALGTSIRAEPDGITEAVRLIEETATRVSTAYPRL